MGVGRLAVALCQVLAAHVGSSSAPASQGLRAANFTATSGRELLAAATIRFPRLNIVPGSYTEEWRCENLTLVAVQRAASKSLGRKELYFSQLRTSLRTSLTRKPSTGPLVQLESNASNIPFLGDSIVREIYQRTTIMLLRGKAQATWSPYPHAEPGEAGLEKTRQAILKQFKARPFDLAVVGGLGVHHLFRNAPCMQGEDPLTLHEELIRSYLVMFHQLAIYLRRPFVYVGTMSVDGMTVLMRPPKEDWADFADFSLPVLWDSTETQIFDGGAFGPALSHLRPSALAARCPGIRCDGLHFGSDFKEFNCHSTVNLWDRFLAEFYSKNIGASWPSE